jgi:hypothetical protein
LPESRAKARLARFAAIDLLAPIYVEKRSPKTRKPPGKGGLLSGAMVTPGKSLIGVMIFPHLAPLVNWNLDSGVADGCAHSFGGFDSAIKPRISHACHLSPAP